MLLIYTFLLFILCRAFRKNRPLSYSLAIFYFVSAVCAILFKLLDPDNIFFFQTEYSPLIFLIICLTIWFFGFYEFKAFNISHSQSYQFKFNRICRYVGLLYFPFVLILAYNAFRVLLFANLTVYRIEADWYSFLQGGVFLSAGIYLSVLSFVPHFLLFLSYYYKTPTLTRILLFLASFSFALTTLCFAGRDGVAYWLMNSVVFYFILQKGYTTQFKKKLIRGALILGGVMLLPIIAISAARFTEGSSSIKDLFLPVLSYIGQPPHIFCQAYRIDPSTIRGLETQTMTQSQFESSQFYLTYTFGTFIKKYYWAYGFFGTIGVSVLYALLSRFFVRLYNSSGSIWIFFIIYTIFQIPLYGVFYYRQSLQRMEIIYLLFAFFCLFQYLTHRGKKNLK